MQNGAKAQKQARNKERENKEREGGKRKRHKREQTLSVVHGGEDDRLETVTGVARAVGGCFKVGEDGREHGGQAIGVDLAGGFGVVAFGGHQDGRKAGVVQGRCCVSSRG